MHEHTTTTVPDALDASDATARLARHMERCLADIDLTLPQLRLLVYVGKLNARGDAPAASEIARQAQIRPPSLTALVDGLASRGLVERRPDGNDRRRVLLHVTDAGSEALHAGRVACQERLVQIASHADDPDEAVAALARWVPLLDAWRDSQWA